MFDAKLEVLDSSRQRPDDRPSLGCVAISYLEGVQSQGQTANGLHLAYVVKCNDDQGLEISYGQLVHCGQDNDTSRLSCPGFNIIEGEAVRF